MKALFQGKQEGLRPRAVAVIGWVFILAGFLSCVGDLSGLLSIATGRSPAGYRSPHPVLHAIDPVAHVLALVGGVFLLRGCDWARWLIIAWLAFHIPVGAIHSTFGGLFHLLLFAVITRHLFGRESAAYFRGARGGLS